MRYCVVTMLFNNYDLLREPLEVDKEADYYCITDNKNLTSNVWKTVYEPSFDTDAMSGIQKTYTCKYQIYKYIPNIEQYNYIIRLDGSIIVYKSLRGFANYLNSGKYDISVAPHPWRNNCIDEYKTWINSRNLDPHCYDSFVRFIKDYDLRQPGLCENTFQAYKNDKEVFNFLDDVYKIMIESSETKTIVDRNDQCYFTYMLYKYFDKLRINFHPATFYRFSDYMKLCYHGSDEIFSTAPLAYDKIMNFFGKTIFVNNISEYEKFNR